MVRSNNDAPISSNDKAKSKWRVSIRYKSFIVEECILTKNQKNAVVHFLFVLSRAMKRDNGECPFYYKAEEVK